MKIIHNNIIPFKGFKCINLFGVLFVRKDCVLLLDELNHEMIHTAQMKELGYVFFYLFYFLEWIVRLFLPGNAYRNISFEKEAYENQRYMLYIDDRKTWNWINYF